MIEPSIDVAYPVFAGAELAIAVEAREPALPAGDEEVSIGSIAHQVVGAALSVRDYERAERTARMARELFPEDETAAADLARVLEAQGQVEQARTEQQPVAHHDRLTPVTDERE